MYFLLSSQNITWSHLDNIGRVVQSGHVAADRWPPLLWGQFCSKRDSKSTVVGAVTLLAKPFCFNTFPGTILQ